MAGLMQVNELSERAPRSWNALCRSQPRRMGLNPVPGKGLPKYIKCVHSRHD